MTSLRAAWLVFAKEVTLERRTGEITVATALFAVLVTVLASLAFYIDPVSARDAAPGTLWITVAFAGVLAAGRSWGRERENGVMRALLLSPLSRPGIYLGKLAAIFFLVSVVEVLVVPVVLVLFQLDVTDVFPRLVALIVTGTLAFTASAALFGALTVETRARDLVLSVVVFPLVAPALLAAVVATRELLHGATPAETVGWLRILLAFDLVFVVGGAFLFEPLTSD